ncbi:VOC family protein [Halioxenophilus sp. WMMB6]|uniref:VOC family protein n=1 Tax=Halioxenophilus sp. WMMB6 TaxID=3073815 RepID=UPI00295E3CC3|nr:VOC family protein [Halioxenophilus sp. WMMB6]
MKVQRLDHINIRTPDIDATIQFYSELLGLRARNTLSMFSSSQSQWLYDHNEQPIIHLSTDSNASMIRQWPIPLLAAGDSRSPSSQTLPIHHVALCCTGKKEMLERLKTMGADFATNELQALKMTQFFTRDPHGILLELNFPAEE